MPDTLTVPVRLTADGKLDPLEDRLVKEIRDLKLAMIQSDVTENMVLGDIKIRDIENLLLIMKSAKTFKYESAEIAFYNIGQFLNRALNKMGVDALNHFAKREDPQNANHRFLERRLTHQLLKKKIKLEVRPATMYNAEDQWRSGAYIYKSNAIAFWISNILIEKNGRSSGGHIILPGKKSYSIITNAPGE